MDDNFPILAEIFLSVWLMKYVIDKIDILLVSTFIGTNIFGTR